MGDWQPIATAPRDGTRLLLYSYDEQAIGFWGVSPRPYKFEGWTTGWETASGYDVGFNLIGGVTHWMPLPEPPPSETS